MSSDFIDFLGHVVWIFLLLTFLASLTALIISLVKKRFKFFFFSLLNIFAEISGIIIDVYGELQYKQLRTPLERWPRALDDGKWWPIYVTAMFLFIIVWWVIVCKKIYSRISQ
ncbi:hypothetical protein [Paenibacillus larvae]|uniref:Uncharacterized protein n=2 Tax=Paenibacillus larvae TaxID=1464 RepID=A0A6C0QNU6_9BACL|nr:hypothetical protein [Paenibacillus larvae]ETK29897.1 hypothetical protein ERIC1_1c34560 [Paenibacillus larvae subsp. larvae DSM 25719]AQR79321.1 hypothetical protein BXP28_20970 [Paenibacillus larvae subsp. larvae]AVF23511.1 hypothetical protein ERICI_03770 [Paenibacillus larvae subsp. larvae]MCY7492054.1 hypothetical protein [Paenibacillus larvae]MCY9568289.1 hypothetical protein [Paenibacillus larvae]